MGSTVIRSIRIGKELDKTLREIAAIYNKSVSEIIKEGIEIILKRYTVCMSRGRTWAVIYICDGDKIGGREAEK
jgi:predicted transcriptional regulator